MRKRVPSLPMAMQVRGIPCLLRKKRPRSPSTNPHGRELPPSTRFFLPSSRFLCSTTVLTGAREDSRRLGRCCLISPGLPAFKKPRASSKPYWRSASPPGRTPCCCCGWKTASNISSPITSPRPALLLPHRRNRTQSRRTGRQKPPQPRRAQTNRLLPRKESSSAAAPRTPSPVRAFSKSIRPRLTG